MAASSEMEDVTSLLERSVMTETFSSSVLKSETMALAASRAAAMASSDGSVEVVASVLSVLLSDFVSKSEALTA